MNTTNIENKLKQKNVRPTAMRLLVYNLLLQKQQAISLTDMEKAFFAEQEFAAPVDRTTIYRTIKTFEKKGVVHPIEEAAGATKYALCDSNCDDKHHSDMHLHFYCISCDNIYCLTDQKIPSINLPDGYNVHELSLLAKGVCKKCNEGV